MDDATPDRPPPPSRGPWVVAAVALGLFLVTGAVVWLAGRPYFAGDVVVTRAVQAIDVPGFGAAMRGVSWAGDDVLEAAVLAAVGCLALWALGDRRAAAVLLGVVLAGQAAKIAVKHLVARPRPTADVVRVLADTKEVYSFPSGHTVHYTVFFGFLWFVAFARRRPRALRRPLLAALGGLVLTVGLARVYLGAHWVSDVIGGYFLGAAILAAGVGLYRTGGPVGGCR